MTPGNGGATSIDFRNINAKGDVTAVIGEYRKYVITHIQSGKKPPLFVNVPPLPEQKLVGREKMLDDLVRRLIAGESPALSTKGMPGVGKTALAIALAHDQRVLAHFTGGVLWADLGPSPDVPATQAAWATALGIDISHLTDPRQRQQAICNALGPRPLLMVLDDAWDLEPARQLRCGGQVVCLLTTRNDDIARKFAPGQALHVPELAEDPSVELLRMLIPPQAWEAAADELRELARAVGGLPLALKLVGGYLAEAEHHRFPGLLQNALTTLQDPAQRLALEQGHLDRVIGLSLEPLAENDPDALAAFYALGAFAPKPAHFTLADAVAVTRSDEAALARLAAHNLVEAGEDDQRLALHQTLADYARVHAPDPEAARIRHRDYYLGLVEEDEEDWQRIKTLYPQLRHAWQQQMAAAPEDEAVIHLVDAASHYQRLRGLWQDNLQWLQAALHVVQKQEDERATSRILNNIGMVYDALGQKQKALEYYQQALPIRRKVGDRAGEANTLNNIGMVYDALGQKQKALEYYQQALPIRRQVGDRAGEANTLNNIGLVYRSLDEMQKAMEYYQQALSTIRQVGDRTGEATILNNIGAVYDALGQKQKALEYFQQALPILRQVGDVWVEIITLRNIGVLYFQTEEIGRAEQSLAQAAAQAQQVGHPELNEIRQVLMVVKFLNRTWRPLRRLLLWLIRKG